MESEYGFPYWKKLNMGTGSRTLATAINKISLMRSEWILLDLIAMNNTQS